MQGSRLNDPLKERTIEETR